MGICVLRPPGTTGFTRETNTASAQCPTPIRRRLETSHALLPMPTDPVIGLSPRGYDVHLSLDRAA